MSIKKDLDEELERRKSLKEEEKILPKKLLEKYLKESDIISILEEIVDWVRDKGFDFKTSYKIDEDYGAVLRFYVEMRDGVFLYHPYLQLRCSAREKTRANKDYKFITKLVSKWDLIKENNPHVYVTYMSEKEMLKKFKDIFINLIENSLLKTND
jgi:hypothetical protein